ncbi:uncharacterized protein LOC142632332 [Castanea sativa]|uniref:uncharacterized protein LOC142632332 n=1 Tax=Castanea sativa TaxID=21020 RepID=UPI003F64B195
MPNMLHIDATIFELIDKAIGAWKDALIKQIFLPTEAQTILSIPRSHRCTHDCMVWAYTVKGNFMVNSAYKVAITSSPNATMEGVSTNDMTGRFWQTFWSLGIPTKLKTFAWRASHNILPTKVNLCRCGVIDNATCEACGLAEETSGHLFWDCTKAHEVWMATGISFDATAHLARPLFKEQVDTRWIPPSHPWYKANIDTALFPDHHTIGIGVIIRDHEGSVITALSKHLPLPLGPMEAEAKVVDEAVSFAWDVRVRKVIFETNSKVVSNALCGTITPRVTIVDIIEGALHRLQAFRRT